MPSSLWQKAVCLLPPACRGSEPKRTRNFSTLPLTLLLELHRSSGIVQLLSWSVRRSSPQFSLCLASLEKEGPEHSQGFCHVFQSEAAQTWSTARAGREGDWATPLCWVPAIQQADGTWSPRKKWVAKVDTDFPSNSIFNSNSQAIQSPGLKEKISLI